jgi:hypothetical protein
MSFKVEIKHTSKARGQVKEYEQLTVHKTSHICHLTNPSKHHTQMRQSITTMSLALPFDFLVGVSDKGARRLLSTPTPKSPSLLSTTILLILLLHIGLLILSLSGYLASRSRQRLHLNIPPSRTTSFPPFPVSNPSYIPEESTLGCLFDSLFGDATPTPTPAPLAFKDEDGLDDINIDGSIMLVPFPIGVPVPVPPEGRSRSQDMLSRPTPKVEDRGYLH